MVFAQTPKTIGVWAKRTLVKMCTPPSPYNESFCLLVRKCYIPKSPHFSKSILWVANNFSFPTWRTKQGKVKTIVKLLGNNNNLWQRWNKSMSPQFMNCQGDTCDTEAENHNKFMHLISHPVMSWQVLNEMKKDGSVSTVKFKVPWSLHWLNRILKLVERSVASCILGLKLVHGVGRGSNRYVLSSC